MPAPTEAELADAIERATRDAVSALFEAYPEHFYYLMLITTGEAHAPFVSAWSHEALERCLLTASDPEKERPMLKWSYADSPYMCFKEELFSEVKRLFDARPPMTHLMTHEEWDAEYELRINAMETAMKRLNDAGLFGTGTDRLAIVVNVEVMPPDATNTARAIRLNPKDALIEWLEECAEP